MNQSPPIIPPEGHEILTPAFLRQFGAVEGMQYKPDGKKWRTWDKELSDYLIGRFPFAAPMGTMALVSTPLPEPVCGCMVEGQSYPHFPECPCHPSNRLVKVLPGLLAGLKEKPESLIWAHTEIKEWSAFDGVWLDDVGYYLEYLKGQFAYALPARVLAAIESERRKCDCHAGDIDANEHHSTCPLSTHNQSGGEPCATNLIQNTAQHAENITSPSVAAQVASNAAPSTSDPLAAAAPTAEEMLDWLEKNYEKVHQAFGPEGWRWWNNKMNKWTFVPTLRAAITSAMQKEGKTNLEYTPQVDSYGNPVAGG